jgi:hypothetical protein
MMRLSEQARARWSIVFRIVAGTLGVYDLTSLATVALSLLLVRIGMDKVEAVTAATLASFVLFAVIAMATFHARSAARAWGWMLAVGLPLAFAVVLSLPGAQP